MIKPLTSLRFFFALFVFLSHLSFVKTDFALYNWLKRNVFFEGYLGVSFFFILSGFVLSYSYQSKFLNRNISKKKFYFARFARIYPLYFLTLILAIPIFYSKVDTVNFLVNIFLLQSFFPFQNYFFSINPPSWSISDEMFFYLIFPFLIVLFRRYGFLKKMFLVILIILVFCVSIIPQELHKSFFYINPFVRSFDFILGILLYELYESKKLNHFFNSVQKATVIEFFSIFLFVIFFSLHNYISRTFRFSIYYWLPMSFFIFTFAQNKGILSRFLSKNILVFLGEISYGFYMFHYLVISVGIIIRNSYFSNIDDITLSGIFLIITIISSSLSFIYFERAANSFIKKKLISQ